MTRNFMLLTLSLLLATPTLTACTVSPRRVAFVGSTNGQTTGGATSQGGQGNGQANGGALPAGSDPPLARLNQVEQVLTQQRFTRVGPAVRNNNMPENGMVAYAIDTTMGACYAAVALGSDNTDLDMVMLDPSGATVAHDVRTDAHPWISFCAAQGGRHIARLQMARGTGSYYYALYAGPAGRQVDLSAVFGGATEQVQVAQIDPATSARLSALDARLSAENYHRTGEPRGAVFSNREERPYPLNLQAGTCYAFATLGGVGATDTDASVVDGSGTELERDASTNIDGLVRFCPEATGTYNLRAKMYGGAGSLFVAAWTQANAQQPTPTATAVIATQSTAGAGLEESARLLDADMRARGYESYGEPSTGELGASDTRDFPISLEGGKCYAVLAVGDSGVRDLDLLLLAPQGREIDRDVEQDARPIVRVCPQTSGDYAIRVSMANGQGSFVYAPYRWPRGTRGPFNLAGLMYVRLAEVTSLLGVEGYEPSSDFMPDRGHLARQGRTANQTLNLPANACFAILAVGGEGMTDLDASLSLGGQQVAADQTRTAFPAVRYCTTQAGRYTLTIQAAAGSGDYFYQVFARGGG